MYIHLSLQLQWVNIRIKAQILELSKENIVIMNMDKYKMMYTMQPGMINTVN